MSEELSLYAKHELWRRGFLRWKCHKTQEKMYDAFKASTALKTYWDCARKLGKSYLMGILGMETCIQKPLAKVYYCCPFGTDGDDIISDINAQLLLDCPNDAKPQHLKAERKFVFANGSEFIIKGVNNDGAKFRRGPRCTLFLGDEVATWDDLDFVIHSIALPMTLTERGRILMASTPPREPGHASAKMRQDCFTEGAYQKFNIYANPLVTPEQIEQYCKASGGQKSTTWRREYLCEWVTDESSAVVPEYTDEADAEIAKIVEKPDYFHGFVSGDPGMSDKTGLLFAYVDFVEQKLVIDDELLLTQANTHTIAIEIAKKEAELGWPPYARIFDDPQKRLTTDLTSMGLPSFPARKDNRDANIAQMRAMVQARDIIIHPRCMHLRDQLKRAIWNKARKDMAREGSRDSDLGHFDLVAALWYATRFYNDVLKHKNPFPPGWKHRHVDPAYLHISKQRSSVRTGRSLADKLYSGTPAGRKLLRIKRK